MDELPGPERLPRGVRRLLILEDRARRDLRRRRFIARTRAEAARVGAGLDLRVHPAATIGTGVRVELWPGRRNRVVVGADTRIGDGVSISMRGGDLTVGTGTDVRRFVTITCGGRLVVGDEVVVSTGVHVHCTEHVEIGSWTIVGEYTTLADSDHVRTTADAPVHHSITTAPLMIGRNVWVGAKATITKGVTVGDQAFVAAHAVVTADVPAGWLAAGIPARAARQIDDVTPT
jgi:acetyltransferase-like isoleucine patch superfamily enzyme